MKEWLCRRLRIDAVRLNTWNINRHHWQMFIHSRLWLGAVAAFVVGFLLALALRFMDNYESIGHVLRFASFTGGAFAFSWIVGIWCATGPDPDPEEEEEDGVGALNLLPAWCRTAISYLIILAAVALLFHSQITDIIEGTKSLPRVLWGVMMKICCIACVIIPVWLNSRRS